MSEFASPEAWDRAYAELRPTYEAFTQKLETLLNEILEGSNVPYVSVAPWLGSEYEAQVAFRARRRDPRAGHIETRIPMLGGVTVVVQNASQTASVVSVITDEFAIDEARSRSFDEARTSDRRARANASPAHSYPYLVAALKEPRVSLAEWRQFAELPIQIDVMTTLHEAWWTIYEGFPFYWPDSFPREARELAKEASAKLAEADTLLQRVADVTVELESRYDEAIAEGDLDLELNSTALRSYVRVSPTVAELRSLSSDAALRPEPEGDQWDPSVLWIEQNLLWAARVTGFRTVGELDQFLVSSRDRAQRLFDDIGELATARGFRPWASSWYLVFWLVLVFRRADPDVVALTDNADEIKFALNTLIGNPLED